tara:strand:+ start:130 stop:612 length:483 start_codon:yes stop_codon:yes gene_type:complete
MLYSIKGNYPVETLPHRIRLSDGSTRTDSSTFTADELSSAGITTVSDPPEYNADTHKLTWDNIGIEWEVVALTQQEIDNLISIAWQGVRDERDVKIKEVEWRIFRYQSEERAGITTHTDSISDLDDYMKKLRDIPQTYSNVGDIIWPTAPGDDVEEETTT